MGTPPTGVIQQRQQHHLKIRPAKSQLEENQGATIKADKIQEWALLEVAEHVFEISNQLSQMRADLYTIMRSMTAPR